MSIVSELDLNGFVFVRSVIDKALCAELAILMGDVKGAGTRGVLRFPEIAKLAQSRLSDLVRPYLECPPLPVRGIYFDKKPNANWLVAWHQDLTLAVKERIELEGFGSWSLKEGVVHVQPPAELLEKMVTVRLHLDAADSLNGALRVLPRSHQSGRLDNDAIQNLRAHRDEVICEADVGDVLLMRPLLLHASSRSASERRRRVLHIEYAGFKLPTPLQWHEVPCQNNCVHYR